MDRRTQQKLEALNPQTVVEQFLDARTNTAKARESYVADLKLYMRWAETSGLHPLTVTHTDLNRYVDQVVMKAKAESTQGRRYSTVKSFFGFLSEQWDVPSPMAHRDMVPSPVTWSPDQPPPVLNFEMFTKIMELALAEPHGGTALGVSLVGINGLKPSEVCATNVEDLTEDNGRLTLRVTKRKGQPATPLYGRVATLARDEAKGRSHGPLVRNQHDHRITNFNLRKAVIRLAASVGVEGVTTQLLRNTAGVVAIKNGATSAGLQEMLGLSGRRLQAFLAHAKDTPEEHGAARVLRYLSPRASRHELLDQVDRLLDDPETHPIAPVVLAGAVLEQHLRMLCEVHNIEVTSEPTIERYKGALIREKKLPPKTGTKVDGWRDLRNDAAHGHATFTRDEAREMAAAIRRFLDQPLDPPKPTFMEDDPTDSR